VIDRVSFRAFVAATEDDGRVREALGIFVPLNRISATSASGHFGNEILILEANLRKKESQAFFQILKEQLPAGERARLRREIPERLEGESHFHLRLDKQALQRHAPLNGIIRCFGCFRPNQDLSRQARGGFAHPE
jgi:hypothetical protein